MIRNEQVKKQSAKIIMNYYNELLLRFILHKNTFSLENKNACQLQYAFGFQNGLAKTVKGTTG